MIHLNHGASTVNQHFADAISFLMPPPHLWKKGACRSESNVHSISFDTFAWKLPNVVQWIPLGKRWPLLIFRSNGQRSRSKLLIFVLTGTWGWSGACRFLEMEPFYLYNGLLVVHVKQQCNGWPAYRYI